MSPGEAKHLRDSLERARERLRYCQRQRERFERENTMDTPPAQRTLRKLVMDERKVETDIGWLQHALGQG